MKFLVKLEEGGMFLLSILMFAETGYTWWWFPTLLLLPDIGMVGYLINNRIGAYCYNLLHHKGLAVVLFIAGWYLGSPVLQLTGAIMFGHAAMDRLLGYGLKYPDSFQHTHLGSIGNS